MNAKLLERLIIYRKSHTLSCAKILLSQKVTYQFLILKKKERGKAFVKEITEAKTITHILLIEARAAGEYWRGFRDNVKSKMEWRGRTAHGKDPANILLDIGYHYLTGKLIKIFQEVNLPTELGIFHKAQSAKAHPLVYDFIEPFRAVIVDDTLLKIIAKKKKLVKKVDKKIIPLFIYKIKKKGETYYFHKKLGYCVTLNYWIKLLLLEFVGAVNSFRMYNPIFPSLRHESRCQHKIKPPQLK